MTVGAHRPAESSTFGPHLPADTSAVGWHRPADDPRLFRQLRPGYPPPPPETLRRQRTTAAHQREEWVCLANGFAAARPNRCSARPEGQRRGGVVRTYYGRSCVGPLALKSENSFVGASPWRLTQAALSP